MARDFRSSGFELINLSLAGSRVLPHNTDDAFRVANDRHRDPALVLQGHDVSADLPVAETKEIGEVTIRGEASTLIVERMDFHEQHFLHEGQIRREPDLSWNPNSLEVPLSSIHVRSLPHIGGKWYLRCGLLELPWSFPRCGRHGKIDGSVNFATTQLGCTSRDNSKMSYTETQTHSQDSSAEENHGIFPHDTERIGNVPSDSAPLGTIPHDAEPFGHMRHASERKEAHTLTVREVARLFENAAVPRTERSIVNWCQPNRMGVARLDCYFDPNERRYWITPESVERAIGEEKDKGVKRPDIVRDTVAPRSSMRRDERVGNSDAEDSNSEPERSELRKQLQDLMITNRAKDMFIEQLKGERQGFVETLTTTSRELGRLEAKLMQLSGDHPRDDAHPGSTD